MQRGLSVRPRCQSPRSISLPMKPVRFLKAREEAFMDASPVVDLYRKLGFQVEKAFEDDEVDQKALGE